MIECILRRRPNRNDIIAPQHRVTGIKRRSLRRIIDHHGEACVLAEGGRDGDVQKLAAELDGGEEGRGRRRELGDGEVNNRATVGFRHDAFESAVVGDAGVAELHGSEGELQAAASQRGFVGDVAIGFSVGYIQVEKPH